MTGKLQAFWDAELRSSGADEPGEAEPVTAIADADAYSRLWFDFRHMTDELVFYGMKAQTSHFVSPLANLLYRILFAHDVFESFGAAQHRSKRRLPHAEPRVQLLPWVKQLTYFLMHFPDVKHGGIETLRRLERSLRRHATQPELERRVSNSSLGSRSTLSGSSRSTKLT